MMKPALAIGVAMLAAGCGVQSGRGIGPSSAGSGSAARAARPLVAFVEGTNGGIETVDLPSSRDIAHMSAGLPSPDWSHIYSLGGKDGASSLEVVNTRTGKSDREIALPGSYQLEPGTPGAVSANGRWVAVANGAGSSRYPTRLAVVDTLAGVARGFVLTGSFAIDAINDQGTKLYLLEYYNTPSRQSYHVRSFDIQSGRLDRNVVVAKGESSAAMAGERTWSVPSKDGQWLYSLFVGDKGPFIHALNTAGVVAVCIDLPAARSSAHYLDFGWSISLSPDGSRLFAVNPSGGEAVEISTSGFSIRTGNFAPDSAQTSLLTNLLGGFLLDASAKGFQTTTAVTSPDGRLLYVPASRGIARIDTATLKALSPLAASVTFSSLALSPDGATLYAVDSNGVLQVVDSTNGAIRPITGVSSLSRILGVARR